METKVKFKVVIGGYVKTINRSISHPFYEVIPSEKFGNNLLPATSIESQVIDYLDTIDKREFMIANDIDMILDYWIPVKKKKVDEVTDFANFCEPILQEVPSIRAQFIATVKALRGILFGTRKNNYTKMKEVLAHMEATNAFANILLGNLLKEFIEKRNDRELKNCQKQEC